MNQPAVPRWALIVRQLRGTGVNLTWFTEHLDTVTGTREQALAALWHQVQTFQPVHPRNLIRRVVCQEKNGWLVINRGAANVDYACEFEIRELVFEWADPEYQQ